MFPDPRLWGGEGQREAGREGGSEAKVTPTMKFWIRDYWRNCDKPQTISDNSILLFIAFNYM